MDMPAGEWSALLVGHQWPGSAALVTLTAAAASRAATGGAHEGYADLLRANRTQILAAQAGLAADAARDSFQSGESRAREIAARAAAKRDSYEYAHRCAAQLRADLEAIAANGNAAIRAIQDSDQPVAAKVSAIVQTVTDAQQQANAKAAAHSANLFDAIQQVLTARDAGVSARQFALAGGVDLDRAFSAPAHDTISSQVSTMMSAAESPPSVKATGPERFSGGGHVR